MEKGDDPSWRDQPCCRANNTEHQQSKARQESSHPSLEAPPETQPASTCSVTVKGNGESHTEGTDVSLGVIFLRHGDCTEMETLALMAVLWAQCVSGQPCKDNYLEMGAITAL